VDYAIPRYYDHEHSMVGQTDQLDLTLRDSIKVVTARMGFFVGQHKYLEERAKISRLLATAES